MDMLLLVDLVSRVVHVLTAITLVGGSIYASFVAAPVLRGLGADVATGVQDALIRRWKWFVHGGITFFLITGFYNYMRAMGAHNDAGDKIYHAFLGVKMLLAFALMLIASGLVGRSKAFQFMRDSRGFWQMILILLAVGIVGLSGFIKTRGIPEAPSSNVPREVANNG